ISLSKPKSWRIDTFMSGRLATSWVAAVIAPPVISETTETRFGRWDGADSAANLAENLAPAKGGVPLAENLVISSKYRSRLGQWSAAKRGDDARPARPGSRGRQGQFGALADKFSPRLYPEIHAFILRSPPAEKRTMRVRAS